MGKPRGRSDQPSLQPLFQPLLRLAQVSEKYEDEVHMGDAELFMDGSHAALDQCDAERNLTAPSTKPEELPETGKEVAVRFVNPSLQSQDGDVRGTSMANLLEGHGDVGMEKQGEKSEELTGLPMQSEVAIGELQGASKLHPLLIEENEPDSELPTWLQPSSAPEGSVLHALYLQLLGAGNNGITERELFECFEKLAEVLSFGSDWKVHVRWHLKTNPNFCEAQGYHYLRSNHQLEVQQTKRSPPNIASTARRHGASSSRIFLSSPHSSPATVEPGLWVDIHEGVVVPTQRKAFQNAVAALSEQSKEFEEMHQSMGAMRMPSSVADPTDSQLVSLRSLSTTSRKRKSPSSHDEELAHHCHSFPGGLPATQAETVAETDVQTGHRCVVQKIDNTGNWRCHMMAMAGETLCKYHRSLQRQEDTKTSLSPNSGSPKHSTTAFKPWIAQDAVVQTRGQCDHRDKSRDGTRSSPCSRIAMVGHRLCEHHEQLREDQEALQRADAQQGKHAATTLQHNQDSTIMGLTGSHTVNDDQSSLSLHPKSATISPRISREASPSHTEAAILKIVDKPATGVSNHDDDSEGEQLQQQMPKSGPKRHHVAAQKTAANVGPLKSQGLIRTPTTPPLPPPYGIRRKTPVKNRDQ